VSWRDFVKWVIEVDIVQSLWVMDVSTLSDLAEIGYRKFRANWEGIIEKVTCRMLGMFMMLRRVP